jgi:hypothetical protein
LEIAKGGGIEGRRNKEKEKGLRRRKGGRRKG